MPDTSTSPDTTVDSIPKARNRPLQRILLVDDDALILTVVKGLLECLGHAVICANNTRAAEEAFSIHGQIELLFCDYNLGRGTTGVVLAKRLTARRPDLAVIIMSGEALEEEILNEMRHRSWSFLPKPMRYSEVVNALKDVRQSA